MSYCIGSRIEGSEEEYIDLLPGNSLSTIEAMAASGFDASEIFRDYMVHDWDTLGLYPEWLAEHTEGNEGRPLDLEIVVEAYHHAIAWGLALQKSFPDQVAEHSGSNRERIEDHLEREEIDRQRVENMVEQKVSSQKNLKEDQIERCVGFIRRPLYYCSKVLPHVQQGKEVYIYYC